MSDIYAKPDLYRKARYNKKLEGDGAEWEEREAAINESADNMRDDHTGFQSQEGGAPTQTPPPVQGKSSRGAAVCLGVLCLLMGGAIVILSIHYILVRLDNEQLSITVQKEQIRYNNLSNSYNQSQNQVKMMKNQMEGKSCPEGWKRFGCSCYFKSTQEKDWYGSRDDCVERGAHLVIITSRQEQELITKLNRNGDSWIGLRVVYEQGRYTWRWLDGSALTQGFWATGLSEPTTYQPYAACCGDQGKWTRHYNYLKTWVCEKLI